MGARGYRSKAMGAAAGGLAGALAAAPAAHADTFVITNKSDTGTGSLRQALDDAQSTGFDRIVFRSGLSGTIHTATQLPHIYGPLSLEGPGADQLTISGAGGSPHRILSVASSPGIDVRISGLTLADGRGPGMYPQGGALRSIHADLTLSRVVVRDSEAYDGGGIAVRNGSLAIVNSTVSGNSAAGFEASGGGVYGKDAAVRLVRSTVSGNLSSKSAFGSGGGIRTVGGTMRILSSTITGNRSIAGGGLSTGGAGSDPSLTNSIVAGNTAFDFDDISGGTWHLAFSLLGSKDGATVNEVVPGSNIFGRAPRLGALRRNGGTTPTHALLGSSPAVNRGAPGAACIAPDQRGAPRAGRCDIGAYERLFCAGALVNRVGTGGRDVLRGTAGRDGMLGLGGGDRLLGFGGHDGLCGGPGNDRLFGGPGIDRLLGQRGFDRLFGGAQRDFLFGGGQGDRLFGQRGPDRLFGGRGRDLLVGGSQQDLLRPGPGRDRTRQ